jgi:hypothetical protein
MSVVPPKAEVKQGIGICLDRPQGKTTNEAGEIRQPDDTPQSVEFAPESFQFDSASDFAERTPGIEKPAQVKVMSFRPS